jgi:hypothetical protein
MKKRDFCVSSQSAVSMGRMHLYIKPWSPGILHATHLWEAPLSARNGIWSVKCQSAGRDDPSQILDQGKEKASQLPPSSLVWATRPG